MIYMAVNLPEPSSIDPVDGVRLGVAATGARYQNRDDLLLIELAEGSSTATTFTRNRYAAAPVVVARQHVKLSSTRYLLVNAGNANAGTGKKGVSDAQECCHAVAELCGATPQQVLPFSTGVIGEYLVMDKITAGIGAARENLSSDNWLRAARAIMTTDTVMKGVSRAFKLGEKQVTISGIAKGSGMIRPDMATMLAYIATDALIEQPSLQLLLDQCVERSFNRVTVDGDTSTNDACVLMATGKSGAAVVADSENYVAFQQKLQEVCDYLAQAMVRDGEGASKFITIEVGGGRTEQECLEVGFTVAHSPLVKTAFFASDPNWGRILAAVGRAPVESIDIEKVSLWLGDTCLVDKGEKSPDYTEQAGQAVMNQSEIKVRIDLAQGQSTATVWTCDLSHDYVTINAEYRS